MGEKSGVEREQVNGIIVISHVFVVVFAPLDFN